MKQHVVFLRNIMVPEHKDLYYIDLMNDDERLWDMSKTSILLLRIKFGDTLWAHNDCCSQICNGIEYGISSPI